MTKETVIDRIKSLMDTRLGYSPAVFSGKAGIDASNFYKMMKGEKPVTTATLKKISQAFRINMKWLSTGEGEMLKAETNDKPDTNCSTYQTYLLPMSAIGGSLVGFDTKGAMATDCEKIISPITDVDFAIKINGNSMYPQFPSGSIALVKKINEKAFIEWGSVFVLDTINGTVIKEVQPSEDGNKIICHSLNSEKYKDFEVECHDIRGWYKVLGCISLF